MFLVATTFFLTDGGRGKKKRNKEFIASRRSA